MHLIRMDIHGLRKLTDMDVRSWISMDMWMSHDIDMGAGWISMLTTSKTTTTTMTIDDQ